MFRCAGVQVNEYALVFFKYSDRCFCISFGCFGNDSIVPHVTPPPALTWSKAAFEFIGAEFEAVSGDASKRGAIPFTFLVQNRSHIHVEGLGSREKQMLGDVSASIRHVY